ncbi:MAG: tetratricopeptide repeat protein [Bacteroidota bacterium]
MKQLSVLLLILLPLAGIAQKEVKPTLAKAEKALRDGKIGDAKSLIDAYIANPENITNKKGGFAKSAGKAYFLKGIIYAAIDTTHNEAFKDLDTNAFATVKESFDKAKEVDPSNGGFITDAGGIMPIPNDQVLNAIAQAYFNNAVAEYQDNKDYKKALLLTENTMYFIPGDTSILLNAGVYFAPAAEEDEKAVRYMTEYIAKGGKSPDPYIMLFGIYRDKEQNMDKALAIAQEAIKKFPNNPDFPKYELDVYVKTGKLPEARAAMEKQVAADPQDKESRYYLGVINYELKDNVAASKWYEEAIKIDPKYYEPHYGLAEIVYLDAKKVKDEMNQLGITPADKKKKIELDKIYVEKLKAALPYLEECEKLKDMAKAVPDERVLDILHNVYLDLGNDAGVSRIEKKLKAMGLLD